MALFSQSGTYSGLGTFAVTSVPNTNSYRIEVKLSLPTMSEGQASNSQVVTLVKKNGSTVYTSNAGDEGFNLVLSCTAGDAISLVLSSSSNIDKDLNVVKTNISISEGPR